MTAAELAERLEYLRGRLVNAERIGRPAHIEHVRRKVEALEAIVANETTQTGVPVVDCTSCGRRHPVTRKHCEVCGAASLFPHAVHETKES